MEVIYLDTHVVLWLYAGLIELIPKKVQAFLEKRALFISPLVSLEIQYLYETKRIKEKSQTIFSDLKGRIGLQMCTQSFEVVVEQALGESWTRDPFDRIITAQARLKNEPLLTKDQEIQKNYKRAFWENTIETE